MNNLEAANSTFTSTIVLTDDILYCPNCNKELTDPKLLPCLHSFCLSCLEICLKSNKILPGQSFYCPLCRTMCRVPDAGVESMKSNVLVRSMHSFLNFRTKLLEHDAVQCSGCSRNNVEKSRVRMCIECNDWLCRRCCQVHIQVKASKSHHLFSSEDLLTGRHDELIKSYASSNYCPKHEERFSSYCTDCRTLLCQMCESTSHVAHDTAPVADQARKDSEAIKSFLPGVGKTIDSLSMRIANLSVQQKNVSRFRKTFHKTFAEEIVKIIDRISQRLHDYADLLHKTVDGLTSDRLEKIARFKISDLKNQVEAAEISVAFSEQVLEFAYAPSILSYESILQERLKKFQKSPKINLPPWTPYELGPCEDFTEDFLVELVGEISYDGRCRNDSSVLGFSTKFETDGKPCVISDLALDHVRSSVVVVDEANKNLKVFDFKGNPVGGTAEDFLKAPVRVVVLRGDDFYLVNDENALKLVSKELNSSRLFSSYKFRQPVGMAQSTNGEILVAEWMTGEIIGFDETGILIRRFPCYCPNPAYLACCFDCDHILVTDWKTHSVKVFHWNGNLIGLYGERGSGPGQLDHPHGVCSDPEKRIVVCDTWNNRVEVLDWKGRFLCTLLQRKDGLLWPQSVAVLRQHCFVAERHGIVKIFEYNCLTP